MESKSYPGIRPLASVGPTFGITYKSRGDSELAVGRSFFSEAVEKRHLIPARSPYGPLGGDFSQTTIRQDQSDHKWYEFQGSADQAMWVVYTGERQAGVRLVAEALGRSLESLAPHINKELRARAVAMVEAAHPDGRGVSVTLWRSLTAAEASGFADFKKEADFMKALSLERTVGDEDNLKPDLTTAVLDQQAPAVDRKHVGLSPASTSPILEEINEQDFSASNRPDRGEGAASMSGSDAVSNPGISAQDFATAATSQSLLSETDGAAARLHIGTVVSSNARPSPESGAATVKGNR